MAKKCVNGNCSLRHGCGMYHQALNTLEASGANGKFDRHSCRKGKCDHFEPTESVPYGKEWERATMKLPKGVIVGMLKNAGQSLGLVNDKYCALLTVVQSLGEVSNG